MTIETYIVDSFTDKPFKGNPAGVCVLENTLAEDKMLLIAKELGLSETAFIHKMDEANKYAIRYFSPIMEIPLCGHATLAASKVLFDKYAEFDELLFVTIQNLDLSIKRSDESILMEFPIYDVTPKEVPYELLEALGLNTVVNSTYNAETNILLLEIDDSDILSGLTPDFEKLKRSHNTINGVLVTAASKRKDYDFESRYFWPWSGTNEDPVTGATHAFLANYWSKKLNKTTLNAFQCSERSGFMEIELISESKMIIKSKAQIILRGVLMV